MTRGPRQELIEDGTLGPAGAELLYGAVAAVAHARRFPPPEGHDVWGRGAVQEVAHDFLTGPRGVKRLADLLLRSVDESTFASLLHTAVLNALRDRGRRTDFGALVLRVTEVLSDSDQFRRDASDRTKWTLASGPDGPSVVSTGALAEAAASVRDVTIPRWSSPTRRSPIADRDSIERILASVLAAAHGSLTAAELARGCEHRLDGRRVPLTVELDVLEALPPDDLGSATEDDTLDRIVAGQVFSGLSDQERLLLATFDRPVRAAASQVGVGHSQTAVLRKRLVEHLRTEIGDDPDAEGVFSALIALTEDWFRQWTGGHDATF